MKKFILILLSLGLAVFLADAAISLIDDSLALFLGIHPLTGIRGLVGLLAVGMGLLIYLLIGITPMIPKRAFLPVALFTPVMLLGMIPLAIYHYDRLPQIAWFISLTQAVLGLSILTWMQGGFRFRWPLVQEEKLGSKFFGWLNLSGFILANAFVTLPGVLVYLALCASLAVDHFSGGFIALHSDRLAMRPQKYVRNDGKSIHLVPMMHIGESGFYHQIAKSFPTNSAILLEGVTDNKNLLKRKLTYTRVAKSLGLSEQQEEFEPERGRPRRADVDLEQFSKESLEFLKLATLLHSQGLTMEVLLQLMQKSQDPRLTEELWDDLLTKRNEHLLKEIKMELSQTDAVVVPWGAAHMRGLSQEIQKWGFRASEAEEYSVLHFRTVWNSVFGRK